MEIRNYNDGGMNGRGKDFTLPMFEEWYKAMIGFGYVNENNNVDKTEVCRSKAVCSSFIWTM